MVARVSIAVALVALSALVPAGATQQVCEVDGERGVVKFCPTDQKQDGNVWTGPVAQTLYSVAGLGLAAGAGIVGWNRVRRRRSAMSTLLAEAESTFASSKGAPAQGATELGALRLEVRQRYEKGRLEDAQFLELDKRIGEFIARLRLIELERRFPTLPPELLADVRSLAADGHVSEEDLRHLGRRTQVLRVPAALRSEFMAFLRGWHAAGPEPLAPARPRRLALVAKPGGPA